MFCLDTENADGSTDRSPTTNIHEHLRRVKLAALLPFGFGLPMIGGALRDSSGSYASTMVLCSFLLLTGVGVLFALYRLPGGELSPGDAEPTR